MNSREISLEILHMILENKSFDDSLEKSLEFKKASKLDQSFISMLILTYLRRHGEIDQIIQNTLEKPLKKSQFKVLNIIRLGITQILFLDTSDWASVNTAVEITKKKIPGLKSLVNAVLRKVCRNKNDILKNSEPIKNIPHWIISSLKNIYDINLIKEISKAILSRPYLDIKIKKREFYAKDWSIVLNGEKIFGETIRIKNIVNIKKLPLFDNGLWWVQGLASSIPVMIIEKHFLNKKISEIDVLEVGSAPGGKTIQLCDLGFKVTALDRSKKRIEILNKNLQRMNIKIEVICKEIAEFNNNRKFDCVLIDAPCSASGLIKRKPEILLNKDKNIDTLISKQNKILEKSSKHIAPKGILVYSVCSLIFEEGEKQIISFLKRNQNFSQIEITSKTLDNLDCFLRNGYINTSPLNYKQKGGVDGFFIACLKRDY